VVVLLAVDLYLKPINGGTFMLFLNSVLLPYETWYKQLQYVMFCSNIKEPLSPVKYMSFSLLMVL